MNSIPPSWSYPKQRFLRSFTLNQNGAISVPMGGGRSYGDSNFIDGRFSERSHHETKEFDIQSGIVTFGSGVRVKDALSFLMDYKMTLPVVPGTMDATIGGCIASDIHGKNSYKLGSFSTHLVSFDLKIGEDLTINVTDSNSLEWNSTIGGQGLSGEIVSARIKAIPLNSTELISLCVGTKNFEELFSTMKNEKENWQFMVGWVDGETKVKREEGYVEFCKEKSDSIKYDPILAYKGWRINFPRINLINKLSIAVFNHFTHFVSSRNSGKLLQKRRWEYIFPMANFGYWNYFFGKGGFHEVQFSCDDTKIDSGIELLRGIISEQTVFLIGIKMMKRSDSGYLGFPGQDWSIAIAFPATTYSEGQIRAYYDKVIGFGGKINLTKDWVLGEEQFQRMFPLVTELISWRSSNRIYSNSNFARRVGIT